MNGYRGREPAGLCRAVVFWLGVLALFWALVAIARAGDTWHVAKASGHVMDIKAIRQIEESRPFLTRPQNRREAVGASGPTVQSVWRPVALRTISLDEFQVHTRRA